MNRSSLLEARIEAQQLRGTASDVVAAARRMLALQGQDLVAVKWALGVRCAAAVERDVDAAFDAGKLVRAWPMRGTLHVVAAEDLVWLQSLTAERVLARAHKRHLDLGITAADIAKARDVAERELAGRRPSTRAQMLELFRRSGLATDGQRGYHLLWSLALHGIVCWGPICGREQGLVLAAEWLPQLPRLDRDDALARLATRYLRGHGPATADDLAWWCGLTKTDARRAFAAANVRTLDDGLCVADAHESAPAPEALLLPGFDEYFLGYADRAACIDPAHRMRVVPGGNGVFLPMVVAHGRIVGTFRRELRADRLRIEVRPFEPSSTAVPIDEAATALARFHGVRWAR